MKIAILGAGAWGTAVGLSLSASGHAVTWWSRHAEVVDSINFSGRHPNLFSEITRSNVSATTVMADVSDAFDCVMMMASSQGCRPVLSELFKYYRGPVILGSKGIELETWRLPHQIAREVGFCADRTLTLSGPSFARDVVYGLPVALVLACSDESYAQYLSGMLSSSIMRFYTATDVLGVELCGAAKNSLAIAAGISDGLSLGSSARAALLTRGLLEMSRLSLALGGEQSTVYGLSGLGDLILTATSDLSRNWRLGHAIAMGQSFEQFLSRLGQVAEGVGVSYALEQIARDLGIEMPIICSVCGILRGQIRPRDAVNELMTRGRG
ncbi:MULTISPECIES: NAD(P)H-dependent glycerol-3-phosphate dehydrogenase [Candidatus Ichthyocystis]|uniref:Glycerol-3-phosphate dehydrogenase [NAD(P)+] n=1 Tax=Candidatus Ichthyocystis hellenicum TaxID=1561003 RepID=A0A0S4LZZ1_9BURK|nr:MULTISPECIES: NAD(P)H-dependent glycerol-3-phosphate dehydrogenase [Ichthyocystis]CUT17141.1 Glycerol-3-phosphate dehydrogenase [Candidatus Ichthyocystis hellenicum]